MSDGLRAYLSRDVGCRTPVWLYLASKPMHVLAIAAVLAPLGARVGQSFPRVAVLAAIGYLVIGKALWWWKHPKDRKLTMDAPSDLMLGAFAVPLACLVDRQYVAAAVVALGLAIVFAVAFLWKRRGSP